MEQRRNGRTLSLFGYYNILTACICNATGRFPYKNIAMGCKVRRMPVSAPFVVLFHCVLFLKVIEIVPLMWEQR